MNNNLKLYINKDEYQQWAGADWPDYESFINNSYAVTPDIQQELDELVAQKKRSGIIFPIRTATSCQSKWTWSTVYLNYLASASCHRVNPVPFKLEEFDNFHNLPKKIQDRELMLSGQWPTGGCEYCRNIEEAGGWSDRQHNLDIPGLTPPELEYDQTATHVTPRVVEIFAQNTCNLSCTYCNAGLSSKIEMENRKYGDFQRDGVSIPIVEIPQATTQYFERFIEWLDKNIHVLVRLHLLGGETFIQHDLMNRVLDIIERKPNPELQFCIFSNLNVPDRYWDLYIGRIRDLQSRGHIRYFDLTASIDCWGPEQEYARYGLNLDKFEQRFAWASEQGDWLRLNANQTVTCLTMHSMPGLIEKIAQYSKNKHIGHYFQFYTGLHTFQHPQIYSYDMWAQDFENIYRAMPRDTVHQLEAIPRMQGLQKQLQQVKQHNYPEIHKLHVYLDELDRRRRTDWRSIFPYLDIHE